MSLSPGKAHWAALPCCRICPWAMCARPPDSLVPPALALGPFGSPQWKGLLETTHTPTALPSSQPRSQNLWTVSLALLCFPEASSQVSQAGLELLMPLALSLEC